MVVDLATSGARGPHEGLPHLLDALAAVVSSDFTSTVRRVQSLSHPFGCPFSARWRAGLC